MDKQEAGNGTELEALRRRELHAAREMNLRVMRVLLRIIEEEGNDVTFLRRKLMNSKDRLRLGIFQAWASRHRVPLAYVIKTLLRFWRNKTRRPGKKSLLGVTIPSLTSPKSEIILAEAIKEDFPGAEHLAEWQTERRQRALGLDESRSKARNFLDPRFPDESCKAYVARILRRRKRLDKAVAGQWRKRRRWRGNPWL